MKYKLNNQKGSALISALLLILVIASVTTAWISQTHFHIRFQHQVNENSQARMLLEAAKIWTVQVLKQKTFNQTDPVIAKLPPKSIPLPPNWQIQAQLSDAQAKINLNTMTEQSLRLSFYLVMKEVLKDEPHVNLDDIYYATVSWIDPNIFKSRFQRYQNEYAKAKPPYQAGGQPMQTLEEFYSVYGVTPKIYQKLKPYITVIPESVPINLNTCDEKIIKSLRPGLKDSQVKRILFARGNRGFRTINELFAVLEEFKIPVQNVTTKSQYFWLEVSVISPSKHRWVTKYLVYRRLVDKTKNTKVIIVQQGL
jgi:general secretion pathway protein K